MAGVCLALWLACRPNEPSSDPPVPEPGAAPAVTAVARPASVPPPPPPPAAIDAEADLIALPLDAQRSAVVSVPRGARPPRPVLVAAHGNFDRPEWQCGSWREIVGARAFILCPRGVLRPDAPSPDDPRYAHASHAALEAEVRAGLEALAARFGDQVAAGAVVWTGFSQGAIMGVPIAARMPATFSRLVLLEGGHDGWTGERARAFAAGGGRRVLFACGQRGCTLAARAAAQRLERAGVASKIVTADGQGHSYGGDMSRLVGAELAWLLEGDPRW